MTFETIVEVRYSETDQSGIVHHSVYPVYFELARIAAMGAIGVDYRDMEQRGLVMAVFECGQKNLHPARYGDRLVVTTALRELTHVQARFEYEVHCDRTPIATGFSSLVCLSIRGDHRPTPIPADIVALARDAVEAREA